MRYAHWTLLTLAFVLVASVAWAQNCPCAIQVPCPPPCPVCACPCPEAVPASLGAGPAANLPCGGCDFDRTYAANMFAQNSVIIEVTRYGMQRGRDGNLRDISYEINSYLTSANGKLQAWYGVLACAAASPDCAKAQEIINQLATVPSNCFDAVYARTLSQLVHQSHAADVLGGRQAVTAPMRQQAQFLSRKEADWGMRLDRWVAQHPATTPP